VPLIYLKQNDLIRDDFSKKEFLNLIKEGVKK
jgi:hypothetical protein